MDVLRRFQTLQQSDPSLNLYGLVDGFQYEQHTGERFVHRPGINRALFAHTEDAPLGHAGPWLIDMSAAADQIAPLAKLERALPAVSWLMTLIDLEGLSQLLRLKLNLQLPDGRKALLRFYDPRVLANLFRILHTEQRTEFFRLLDEWHFLDNGRRVRTGRTHA